MADDPVYSPEPGKVAIRDSDGSVWKVPVADLAKAQAEGARPATEAEYQAGQLGAAGQVGSAVLGGARGVSLGHSDALYIEGARALGGDESAENVRHVLNLANEMHPDAAKAGEYAGMALPMFFGGGGAAAVKGESMAARALAAAPRAFGEGAAIGMGQQSSEDALGDHRVLAENYLSAGFKGGAVGVLLGSGLHALTPQAGRFGRGLGADAEVAAEKDALRLTAPEPAPRLHAPAPLEGAEGFEGPIKPAGWKPPTERYAPGGEQLGLPLGPGSAQAELPFTPPELPSFERKHMGISPGGLDAGLAKPTYEPIEPFSLVNQPRTDIPGASYETLLERSKYGGRKGASAERRLAEFPTEDVAHIDPRVEARPFKQERGYIGAEPAPFEARFGAPNARAEEQLDLLGGRGQQRGFDFGPGPREPIGELREPPMFERGPAPEPVAPAPRVAPVVDPAREEAARVIAAERRPYSSMGLLQDEIDRQAFNATGARVPDVRKLGADAQTQDEVIRRVGATLNREVKPGPLTSLQDYAEQIATRTKEVGQSIRPMVVELDKAATRPELSVIMKRFDAEVRRPIGAGLFGEEELALAEKSLERLQEKGGANPSFTKLYDLRRTLDDKLSKHFARIPGGPVVPGEQATRALRDIIQDEMMNAAERASSELGSPIAQRLRAANALYKDLKIGKDIATKEAARAAGSPAYSASDMMSVVAAMASGSPLGAAIPVANVIRKKFGNQIAGYVLRKAANFEAVQNAANRIDTMLNKGSKAVIEGSSAGARAPGATLTAAEVREIRAAASNPAVVQSRVAQALGDMPEYAPRTASEFSLAAARTAAYLASQLPKEKAPTSPIFTGKTERPMSDTELRQATAIVEVAKDPSIVLDRMQQGLLTAHHVKALKATSPQSFYKIQDYLTRHAAELRPTMSIQQQVSLSILFQKPIAQVMERSNITALQASFVGGNQGPPKGMAPSIAKMAAGPVHGGGTRATTFDMAEKGGRK